jgi:hypothetical protein
VVIAALSVISERVASSALPGTDIASGLPSRAVISPRGAGISWRACCCSSARSSSEACWITCR